MKHEDLRTPEQIFDDMVADEKPWRLIAARLGWTIEKVTEHFEQIRKEMGE